MIGLVRVIDAVDISEHMNIPSTVTYVVEKTSKA